MKKKLTIFLMLIVSVFSLVACGKSEINLNQNLIEERNSLFTANDEIYTVTLSSGKREQDYALDGVVNPLVDFAVLTLSRNNSNPLANDTYSYTISINENVYSGELIKSPTDNSYSVDLEICIPADAVINAKIDFTGYRFDKNLENVSNNFNIDKNKAIEIATNELKTELQNLISTKNNSFEVVMKLLKDHSDSELKTYYWYIGIVATNGETLGILIDTNTGDIIAKKV